MAYHSHWYRKIIAIFTLLSVSFATACGAPNHTIALPSNGPSSPTVRVLPEAELPVVDLLTFSIDSLAPVRVQAIQHSESNFRLGKNHGRIRVKQLNSERPPYPTYLIISYTIDNQDVPVAAWRGSGSYEVLWDGSDDSHEGKLTAPGEYSVLLTRDPDAAQFTAKQLSLATRLKLLTPTQFAKAKVYSITMQQVLLQGAFDIFLKPDPVSLNNMRGTYRNNSLYKTPSQLNDKTHPYSNLYNDTIIKELNSLQHDDTSLDGLKAVYEGPCKPVNILVDNVIATNTPWEFGLDTLYIDNGTHVHFASNLTDNDILNQVKEFIKKLKQKLEDNKQLDALARLLPFINKLIHKLSYGTITFDRANYEDIPVTFGTGVTNSGNAVVYNWDGTDNNGKFLSNNSISNKPKGYTLQAEGIIDSGFVADIRDVGRLYVANPLLNDEALWYSLTDPSNKITDGTPVSTHIKERHFVIKPPRKNEFTSKFIYANNQIGLAYGNNIYATISFDNVMADNRDAQDSDLFNALLTRIQETLDPRENYKLSGSGSFCSVNYIKEFNFIIGLRKNNPNYPPYPIPPALPTSANYQFPINPSTSQPYPYGCQNQVRVFVSEDGKIKSAHPFGPVYNCDDMTIKFLDV